MTVHFFFENLFNKIEEFQNDNIIMCGDFNMVINQNLDTKDYLHDNNPKAKKKLIEKIELYDLKDVYREYYPNLKKYTWRKKNPPKQARLDFFLVSNSLMPKITTTRIETKYRSDHSPVLLEIKLSDLQKGQGLWKLNTSLLKDKQYIDLIKNLIKEIKSQYAVVLYKRENIEQVENKSLQFTISDYEFLDILLMEIRQKTVTYSIYKRNEQKKAESSLLKEITKLENDSNIEFERLEQKQNELIDLRKVKMRGKFIRSRALWIEEGERPTKYFCKMESRNY
ncbi:hypothetical protein SNE40_001230 [Patella caerulea]|uniref:Endonuclease/exonuclease/phosphatase domain-containing protein n=2 Tax=Patella caerulea TaxID=87958 RepID=A0AAN8Q7X2_PATCE